MPYAPSTVLLTWPFARVALASQPQRDRTFTRTVVLPPDGSEIRFCQTDRQSYRNIRDGLSGVWKGAPLVHRNRDVSAQSSLYTDWRIRASSRWVRVRGSSWPNSVVFVGASATISILCLTLVVDPSGDRIGVLNLIDGNPHRQPIHGA